QIQNLQKQVFLLILSSFLLFFSTSHHHHRNFYAQPLKKECSISSSTVKEGMLMLKLRRYAHAQDAKEEEAEEKKNLFDESRRFIQRRQSQLRSH
ncbi:hypothetical protein LINPERPRIM_LOCUS30982, partial [Linum perenne]